VSDFSLSQEGRSIIDECAFVLVNGKEVEFQFPPRVKSDSNSSTWEEQDLWSIEPLKIHHGSSGRRISMEWEYLASDPKWTVTEINTQLRNLRSYFFEFSRKTYPVAAVKCGGVIPIATKFRIMDVNVAYSDELIDNGGIGPLHYKVTTTLELATNLSKLGTPTDAEKEQEKLNVQPLGKAQFDWY
jgi:hypothetical protein